MSDNGDMVAGMAWKYSVLTELLRTRLAQQATGATQFPPDVGAVRRQTMHAVATRFPGALRELERCTLAGLEARDGALQRLGALDAAGRAQALRTAEFQWVRLVWRYHRVLADLLACKRNGPLARALDAALVTRMARPPRGRLSALAVQWVAETEALGEDVVLRALHPG